MKNTADNLTNLDFVFTVRSFAQCHVLEAFYIPLGQNFRDFLTKALSAPLHEYHTDGLLYQIPPDQQLPFGSSD
jgi:hypothetical protein